MLACLFWSYLSHDHQLFSLNRQKQSSEVFCKKCVLRNFVKFTGKDLCQSLYFNKVAVLRLWQKCFPVNTPVAVSECCRHMSQGFLGRTKWNLWKTAFKKFEDIDSLNRQYHFDFFKKLSTTNFTGSTHEYFASYITQSFDLRWN